MSYKSASQKLEVSEPAGRAVEQQILCRLLCRRSFPASLSIAWRASDAHAFVLGVIECGADHQCHQVADYWILRANPKFSAANDRFGFEADDGASCEWADTGACKLNAKFDRAGEAMQREIARECCATRALERDAFSHK